MFVLPGRRRSEEAFSVERHVSKGPFVEHAETLAYSLAGSNVQRTPVRELLAHADTDPTQNVFCLLYKLLVEKLAINLKESTIR
jgi:hypothetical protein